MGFAICTIAAKFAQTSRLEATSFHATTELYVVAGPVEPSARGLATLSSAVAHIVSKALVGYFDATHHTLYQVSSVQTWERSACISAAIYSAFAHDSSSSLMVSRHSGQGHRCLAGTPANELDTAVRLHSHVVHMVWIDGAYDLVAAQKKLNTTALQELLLARSIM
jgi:hypothetical protein